MSKGKLILPTLRSRMGDWIYYSTIMKFDEVSSRVSMANEIHQNEGLKSLIQREVQDRTKGIVEYLKTQDQRFFNSLILGIYQGSPTYQELDIKDFEGIQEEDLEYLKKTFGILTLGGDEKLFAIDGQHRVKAIKESIKEKSDLKNEEISVIFLPHKNTEEGLVRTRRVFSTLNRYAKPVDKSEIIAIDEEDNCAIITRNLIEEFELFNGIILFNKTRSISINNTSAFTNIIVLYDFVVAILTDQKIFGVKVDGEDHKKFTHRRQADDIINAKQQLIEVIFTTLFHEIPSLNSFLESKSVNRRDENLSILFKPVGQNVLYSTLKVAMDKNKKDELIDFFKSDSFNLGNVAWKSIFIDSETDRMKTDKTIQKYAFQLILKKIGINLTLTDKDQEVFNNFNIDINSI
jgi:DNA sulfur modification protein DndB